MVTIALSKSSLQQQRDRLRLYERFLPSLKLKRQQLTAEYKKAVQVLAEAEQGADQASRSLTALLPILGSTRMQLSGLVRIRHVDIAEEDVLGLRMQGAVRRVTQRANLFEKVLIPNAKRDIARIQIFLSDVERAAVVTSKIAKAKRAQERATARNGAKEKR